ALSAVLAQHAANAGVPVRIIDAALRFAVDPKTAVGAATAPVVALAQRELRNMFLVKLKLVTGALLTLGVVGMGGAALGYRLGAAEVAVVPAEDRSQPQLETASRPRDVVKVPARQDGVLTVIGTEIKSGEKVP